MTMIKIIITIDVPNNNKNDHKNVDTNREQVALNADPLCIFTIDGTHSLQCPIATRWVSSRIHERRSRRAKLQPLDRHVSNGIVGRCAAQLDEVCDRGNDNNGLFQIPSDGAAAGVAAVRNVQQLLVHGVVEKFVRRVQLFPHVFDEPLPGIVAALASLMPAGPKMERCPVFMRSTSAEHVLLRYGRPHTVHTTVAASCPLRVVEVRRVPGPCRIVRSASRGTLFGGTEVPDEFHGGRRGSGTWNVAGNGVHVVVSGPRWDVLSGRRRVHFEHPGVPMSRPPRMDDGTLWIFVLFHSCDRRRCQARGASRMHFWKLTLEVEIAGTPRGMWRGVAGTGTTHTHLVILIHAVPRIVYGSRDILGHTALHVWIANLSVDGVEGRRPRGCFRHVSHRKQVAFRVGVRKACESSTAPVDL